MTRERVESLLQAVESHEQVLILPHNDPDPDAIASTVALRHLFTQRLDIVVHIAYRGIVGRAENKALVRYLDHPLRRLTGANLRQMPIVLVDTQPGAGNNALLAQSTLLAVIDHHAWRDTSAAAAYVDVRPQLGATSTIVTEYLQVASIEPSPQLATALFYVIKTDTMGLIRGASDEDVAAYFWLQPRIDVEALVGIERAQVPAEYFQKLDAALRAARLYGKVVWVMCTGVYKDTFILAIRTRSHRGDAGALAQEIVGQRGTAGGHGTMAGGQIPLGGRDPAQLETQLGELALQYLTVDRAIPSRPLI